MRHFLEVDDLSADELRDVLDAAPRTPTPTAGARRHGASALCSRSRRPAPASRSRWRSCSSAATRSPCRAEEVGLDVRESVEDVARTLAGYHAVDRRPGVRAHAARARWPRSSSVPVVNLLSDARHPCQALADLLTIAAALRRRSRAAGRLRRRRQQRRRVARARRRRCSACERARRVARRATSSTTSTSTGSRGSAASRRASTDPTTRCAGADVVYTDVWTSMGQEAEADARRGVRGLHGRRRADGPAAGPTPCFLHCLPAHRGEEVAADVIDGPRAAVWQQAANRMHAARGARLAWLRRPRRP